MLKQFLIELSRVKPVLIDMYTAMLDYPTC